jgi:hypothetical protein
LFRFIADEAALMPRLGSRRMPARRFESTISVAG